MAKKPLRLLFLNAQNLFTPDETFYQSQYTKEEYDEKINWISSMITYLNGDVCALSEVGEKADQCLKDIVDKLPKNHPEKPDFAYYEHFTPARTGEPIRVAVISRYKLKNKMSLVKYSDDFSVDLLEPGKYAGDEKNWKPVPSYEFSRPVGQITVCLSDTNTFNLFILHLKSKRPKFAKHDGNNEAIAIVRSAIQRNVEAAALRHYLDTFLPKQYTKDSNVPSILVGDFNDVPNSVPLENIRGKFDRNPGPSRKIWAKVDRHRLISCARLHLKKVAYDDKLFSYVHNENFSLIDQAFVTQHLVTNFKRMEVYNDHVFRHQELKHANRTKVDQQWMTTVSDHGVVLIELSNMIEG